MHDFVFWDTVFDFVIGDPVFDLYNLDVQRNPDWRGRWLILFLREEILSNESYTTLSVQEVHFYDVNVQRNPDRRRRWPILRLHKEVLYMCFFNVEKIPEWKLEHAYTGYIKVRKTGSP